MERSWKKQEQLVTHVASWKFVFVLSNTNCLRPTLGLYRKDQSCVMAAACAFDRHEVQYTAVCTAMQPYPMTYVVQASSGNSTNDRMTLVSSMVT